MMKKKLLLCLSCLAILISLTGCNFFAKTLGGDITITLKDGEKLELITWKDNSIWYLTRPMRDGDVAETYIFQEVSNSGLFEGTVTIIESDKE